MVFFIWYLFLLQVNKDYRDILVSYLTANTSYEIKIELYETKVLLRFFKLKEKNLWKN